MKNLDKEKLKKWALWFAGYIVLFLVIALVVAHMRHLPYRPNVIQTLVAALLCSLATVYIPRL